MRDFLDRNDDVRVAPQERYRPVQGDAAIHQVTGANFDAILPNATDFQEQQFAKVFQLFGKAIEQKAFPGAALAVTHRGILVAWRGFGRFTFEVDAPHVTRETLWDLASLTKAIATTSMAMLLFDRGKLDLDTPVAEVLPAFDQLPEQSDMRRGVTVGGLLAHSSGLPAHRKLYLECVGRDAMMAAALRIPLEVAPGTRAEYSDIGFIILGEILEQITGEPLDTFCAREIFDPIKLNFMFNPSVTLKAMVAPTVIDTVFRHRTIDGEVNDENASAMGGVAGHAGLFGDALSVARFSVFLLRGGESLVKPETVRLFTSRRNSPLGSSRTFGWDTPSYPSQSGTKFSGKSFGHLGYTGTSLWCDPEREVSVTLLSNRTWPYGQNQAIKGVRPAIHDAIVSALENE